MTKAKRYEGEALRAEHWHNMGRSKALGKRLAGLREIEPIVQNKFDLYCGVKYDPVDCGYLVVTEVSRMVAQKYSGIRVHGPEDLIFVHEEPVLEFPSDHLKTKLILLAG